MAYISLMSIIGILLLIAGMTDIRKKYISRGFIFILLIVCAAAAVFKENYEIYNAMGGFTIGMCAIGISVISREQIGKGDGFVIAAIGLVLGFKECLVVVCMASLIMSAAAVIFLITKKGNKYTKLPFLPAICAGYVLCTVKVFI